MRKPLKCAGWASSLALLPISVAVAAEPGANALDYPGPAWSPYVAAAPKLLVGVMFGLAFVIGLAVVLTGIMFLLERFAIR